MSDTPKRPGPPREVIAPSHVSLRKEVGRETGPAPLEYGEVRLWVVAKCPCSLFAYWEFHPEEHPEAVGPDGRVRFFLRLVRDGKRLEPAVEIDPAKGDCTLPVPGADALYSAELGFFNAQNVWCFLARSGPTRMRAPDPRAPK